MGRLNLGACVLAGFWTFVHGAPALGTLYWLCFLPLPPISVGIMIYLLFNGNRVALQRRRYRDREEFRRVEGRWSRWGAILALPGAVLLALYVGALLSYAREATQ
ncbi:MAG: hypothetical protein JOZ24_12325 [Candidatus Eremiobacteraeota bacterium]|nr:hypothetical protein [Candidatus Eremiobacteraeota bacterium]